MSSTKRRDGSGSVYQRADGRWVAQARYYDPVAGRSVKRRRYAATRDKARQLLASMQAEPNPAALPSDAHIPVAEYVASWIEHTLPVTGLAPKTIEGYALDLRAYAIPTLGRITLAEFSPSQAERWVARLGKHQRRDGHGPIAISTQRGTFNALHKALNTAVRDRIIPENPLDKVARPKGRGKPVPHADADHVVRVLAAADGKRIEPLLYLVALTGMRVGEALALRWTDVDLKAGTATIRRGSLTREATKNERVRTVTLLPEVVEHLAALRRRQREDRLAMGAGWHDRDGLVFTTGTGMPLDYRNAHHELVRVLKAAGLATARPWHTLRHGLATRLLERGLPMPVVSSMLGHSSIKVTVDLYGHVNPAVPADVLAAALGR